MGNRRWTGVAARLRGCRSLAGDAFLAVLAGAAFLRVEVLFVPVLFPTVGDFVFPAVAIAGLGVAQGVPGDQPSSRSSSTRRTRSLSTRRRSMSTTSKA